MSRGTFEGAFPCPRPPEGFALSRGLSSLPTGAGWPDEYLALAHKLSLFSPKIRVFLGQKSRFVCKIRHKRSFQLQIKWCLIFVVLAAEQNNLRLIFCCCSLVAGVLTSCVNLDYSLKYGLCSSYDHLCTFSKLVFLHLSLEFLDKLILYGDSISGWDNLSLVGQSQSSTTEPKHSGQKKRLICVKGLSHLGTSHSLGVSLFQGASRIIICLNKDWLCAPHPPGLVLIGESFGPCVGEVKRWMNVPFKVQ